MSSSTPIRFLLDENVRIELATFLSGRKIDFADTTKSTGDKAVAAASLREERVVVTNDKDFSEMCKGEVFGIVWLRIPQNDPSLLIMKFREMLDDASVQYADSLVILEPKSRHKSELLILSRSTKNS